MVRVWIGLLTIAGLVAGLVAANFNRGSAAPALDWQLLRKPPLEVTLEEPGLAPIVQTIMAPGEVELVEEAEISSQIVGRVLEVRVRDGDAVKAGDVLVRLDSTDATARLDSIQARMGRLKAAIDQADAEREKAVRDLTRTAQLAGRGAASVTEQADARSILAKADAALAMSRNELSESEALRRSNEEELNRTLIRSPIDGVVAGLKVEVGEVVIAGTTNLPGTILMTVGDPTRLRVRADIDETDVPLVKPGQPARVYLLAEPDVPVPATVDRVASKGTKTGEVVSFETLVGVKAEGTALRPGMTVSVEVEVRRTSSAVSVPVQAVVHRRLKDLPKTPELIAWLEAHGAAKGPSGGAAREAESRYVKLVFVVENGVARFRPVETGLSDERRVEILDGLPPGTRVVVGPFRSLDELRDGSPVTEESPLAAATTPATPAAAVGARP